MKQRKTAWSLKEATENSLPPELSTFLLISKPVPVPIPLLSGFLSTQSIKSNSGPLTPNRLLG